MKLNQLKTRLILSVVIGIFAVLIYNSLLAQIKSSNVIGFSNIMNALWKSIPIVQVFLFTSVLSLIVTSIPELIKKRKSQLVIISVAVGLVLVVTSSILEFQLNKKRLGYITLDTAQVIELYEKVKKEGDIEAIVKLAVHPNLPDSIQEKLSDSEHMEIRRNIAYETESEEILKKLSSDKEWEVRLAVATNKLTPIATMKKLQIDKNEDVKIIANSIIQQRQ